MDWSTKIIFGIIFPLMFCLVGGGVFAKDGYVHLRTKRDKKKRCLSQTTGRIVDISAMRMKRRLAYFPTYEYVIGSKTYRIEIHFGTTKCQYKIGDEIVVWYDSSSPDYSYIDGYKEDNITATFGLIMGSLAALLGLYVGYVVWFG